MILKEDIDRINFLYKKSKDGELSEEDAKKSTEEVQKIIDKYSKEVDEIVAKKEKEVMEV